MERAQQQRSQGTFDQQERSGYAGNGRVGHPQHHPPAGARLGDAAETYPSMFWTPPHPPHHPYTNTQPQIALQPHHWSAASVPGAHPVAGDPNFVQVWDNSSCAGMMPAAFFAGPIPQTHRHQQWPNPLMYNPTAPHFVNWNASQWRGNGNGRGRGRSVAGRNSGHHQHFASNPTFCDRPSLTLPGNGRKKRKKDEAFKGPLDRVTIDPVVREPQTEAERKEVEAWKAQRRRNWPTEATVERKKREAAERHSRGELDSEEVKRRQTLREILHKQRMMGLSKKAGTVDLLHRFSHKRPQQRKQRHNDQATTTVLDAENRCKDDDQKEARDSLGGLESLLAYASDGDGDGGGGKRSVQEKTLPLNGCATEKGSERLDHNSKKGPGRVRQSCTEQPTLLEKLLAKEIRQERSYVLQAIRFFVMNDFFKNYAPGTALLFPEKDFEKIDRVQG